jgi:hypothetical protein
MLAEVGKTGGGEERLLHLGLPVDQIRSGSAGLK